MRRTKILHSCWVYCDDSPDLWLCLALWLWSKYFEVEARSLFWRLMVPDGCVCRSWLSSSHTRSCRGWSRTRRRRLIPPPHSPCCNTWNISLSLSGSPYPSISSGAVEGLVSQTRPDGNNTNRLRDLGWWPTVHILGSLLSQIRTRPQIVCSRSDWLRSVNIKKKTCTITSGISDPNNKSWGGLQSTLKTICSQDDRNLWNETNPIRL